MRLMRWKLALLYAEVTADELPFIGLTLSQ